MAIKRKKTLLPRKNTKTTRKTSPKSNTSELDVLCVICGKAIPTDRISALLVLGKTKESFTHVKCSQETKKQGIYLGEVGTSEMKVVSKVYQDSIHDHFTSTANSVPED